MATTKTRKKAASKAAATNSEPQYADRAEKKITPKTQLFADWISENTGYDPDPLTIQLVRALNGTFQKSDVNQEAMAAAREAREAEAEEKAAAKKAAPAKKSAPAKKATARKRAAAEETDETPAPAKKGAAPRRRRRAAAAAGAEGI